MHVGCETEGLELAPRGEGAIEVLELRARLDDHVDRRQRHGLPLGAPRLEDVVGVVDQLRFAAELVGDLVRVRVRTRARARG